MSEFYTIVTNIGAAKIANAEISEQKLNITHYAVGDGNGSSYNPTHDQTSLRNEVWRGPAICMVDEDEANIINIDATIPPEVGGFLVREIGIFDADGDLIIVGKVAEYYKPIIAQGSTLDAHLRTKLVVSNSANVVLKNDPNLITATRGYVDAEIVKISGGLAKLSTTFTKHLDDYVEHLKVPPNNEATLVNGWLGSFLYSKDAHNNLQIAFNIHGGVMTHGTVVTTLPIGFRPLNQRFVTANTLSVNDNDNTSVGIQVGSDGTVKLSGTAKSRITGYCTLRVVQ